MNWDILLDAFTGEVAAMPAVVALAGEAVRYGGEVEHEVPSCVIRMISDTESELWAPVTVQVDLFHKSAAVVLTAERALRRRYHADLPIPIGNLNAWAQYSDGTVTASPERDGYFGRALRFTFTPLRAAYSGG